MTNKFISLIIRKITKNGQKYSKKSDLGYQDIEKSCIFAPSNNEWFGSSVWLEYVPVTHGVAGSSPVRTAPREANQLINNWLAFFIKTSFQLKTPS